MLEISTTSYTTYQPYYKEKSEMTEFAYKLSLFRPPSLLLSPLAISFNYIVKVMKPLHNMQEACITQFAIYYLYYKDKLRNLTWGFVFAVDNFHSLCSLSNLSTASICTTKPGLVIKKTESPKTSIYIFFKALQLPPLILSSMLTKIHLVIFKFLVIFKCMLISEWQFSLILTSLPLLADYLLIKLTSQASLNLFRVP